MVSKLSLRSWQHGRYLSVRKSNIWYRDNIKSDNKSFECKREKTNICAGFLLSKNSPLGSFKVLLDWSMVHSKIVIITQPLFPLRITTCCWDLGYFCMGKRQNGKGFCLNLLGMHFLYFYITHIFIPYQLYLLQHFKTYQNLVSTLSLFKRMALIKWVPPSLETLKVNMHAAIFAHQMPNGNTNGIVAVLRTSDGNLVNFDSGTIHNVTPLGAKLWAVQVGLRRAFVEGAMDVIVETDNMQVFGAIQFVHLHQRPEHDDLIHQILTRIRDPNWNCSFRFVYSARNTTATYASLLGVNSSAGCICSMNLWVE